MAEISSKSFISSSIAHSDKNSWQIAGEYLDAHPTREAALISAVNDVSNGTLPDVLIAEGLAFPSKEILFFIANRPVFRNEPNI